MATRYAWRDKPFTTTSGVMDTLYFESDRLAKMREVVRKMVPFEQNYSIPPALRSLVIDLTCMVRTDDEEDARTTAEIRAEEDAEALAEMV